MLVQCSKNILLSIFWCCWDVLVPLPYPPGVSRKMKIPQSVQKIVLRVTALRMCLWLLGELQTITDPKTSHAKLRGFVHCCGVFFPNLFSLT